MSDRAHDSSIGLRWLALERHRLGGAFHGDEAPTGDEVDFLRELARRANDRGEVNATRAELAARLGWSERTVGTAISWARWRGSLVLRRMSAKSEPPAYQFNLRAWPRGHANQTPGA